MKINYSILKAQYNYVLQQVFTLQASIDYLESLGTEYAGYKKNTYLKELQQLNERAKELDLIIYNKYKNYGPKQICNAGQPNEAGAETILQNSPSRCAQ
jgi:hypothetical protein